tara:strand:+ start:3477 stop:4463 length:987 start_codon:yes stop_codon:yes gene_type:complete
MNKPKIAIGCIVQWYEVEMYQEYLQSIINAIKYSESNDNVFVDLCFYLSENIEQLDTNLITPEILLNKFKEGEQLLIDNNIKYKINYYNHNPIYTIADYRREFNDIYCQKTDVLMWGESDSLIPQETFQILESLHINNLSNNLRKYIAFFGTNKMWDDSWKDIEYTRLTDKPFIHGDNENWWSINYITSLDELYDINGEIEELELSYVQPYKFNGCGLVISSDIIKSGVNIPRSIMLVHEDTAFQNSLIKYFGNSVPQFSIKNVYLVHNRKHPKKRLYVKGEQHIEGALEKRKHNEWYQKVWDADHIQAHNPWGQHEILTWENILNNE